MKPIYQSAGLLLAASLIIPTVTSAKVSPEEAALLGISGTALTPVGAERAGNADGTIPAWSGGITELPAGYTKGGWYVDPFADDEIIFTITYDNYKQYADKLTTGTQALFERYPETFTMQVYPSRRSASYPDWYYQSSIANASTAEWCGHEEPTLAERCIKRESRGRGIIFPIPKTGGEVMWNHTYAFFGKHYTANAYGINVFADGSYADHQKIDRWFHPHYETDQERTKDVFFERGGGSMLCFSQEDISPPRTAGQMFGGCNSYANNDFDAYLYIPGQRRVRKAPELGFYDSPGTGSDGLRTADQRLAWFITGGEEWYVYEQPYKKEFYVPYNAYKMAQPGLTFDDVARPGHVNPDIKRYELHRSWVVEGRLRPGYRHLSPHRLAYIDEDSWHATNGDMYDAQDNIWRVSELYNINFYDQKLTYMWADSHMDLVNGRYACINAWHNMGIAEGNGPPDFDSPPELDYYKPSGLRKRGVR